MSIFDYYHCAFRTKLKKKTICKIKNEDILNPISNFFVQSWTCLHVFSPLFTALFVKMNEISAALAPQSCLCSFTMRCIDMVIICKCRNAMRRVNLMSQFAFQSSHQMDRVCLSDHVRNKWSWCPLCIGWGSTGGQCISITMWFDN